MKLPALRNAVLTKVEGRTFTADYDRDATAGPTKWTGSEEVFWSERVEEVPTGGAVDIIIHRSLVIDADIPISWAIDDTVTVTRDGATVTGIVQRYIPTKSNGLPGVVRVILENA